MISWNQPGRANPGLVRADGTRYKTGKGRRGTYEWVIEDTEGLSSAYFYPIGAPEQGRCLHCGQPAQAAEVLVLQTSMGKAYRACVDHDQAVTDAA